MREAVRREPLQPARESPLELELERVVVRGRIAGGERDRLEIRIHVRKLGHAKQVPPNRADISQRHALSASQGLLDRDIPLITTRKLQMPVRHQNVGDRRIQTRGRSSRILRAERKRCRRWTDDLRNRVRKVGGDSSERALPEIVENSEAPSENGTPIWSGAELPGE